MIDRSRLQRRKFICKTGLGLAVLSISGSTVLSACKGKAKEEPEVEEETKKPAPESAYTGELKISLAQWSHHKEFFSGVLKPINFAQIARGYGINAIEYVNQFFADKAKDKAYLDELNLRANDLGIVQHLIMIDNEGELATPDDTIRSKAIENHYKWVEAAKYLGCRSIRVNLHGNGTELEMQTAAVDSLGVLADFAKDFGINVIVENHGGFSSNGQWLSSTIRQVDRPNCGTLPDFGNFCLKSNKSGTCVEEYDRYLGVQELLPYAKAVSAKSFDFSTLGGETTISYDRMIDLVKIANYSGYIGIEYEGDKMPAEEGILATKRLLERYI